MKKTIVLADGSKSFLMYISLLLKRLGFQLLSCRNGIEALSLIRSNQPDLVMLDVHMEMLDGIATLRHIRSDHSISGVPVIMMSMDISPETIKACEDLGCAGYLPKPIKVDQLNDAIQRSLLMRGSHCRKHIRTSCGRKVTVDFQGMRLHFYTETFSAGGIYVRTENPLPSGSDVVVSLDIDHGKQRRYKGRVIYIRNEFGDLSTMSPGMAIKFMDLSAQDKLELNSFMKSLVAGDILDEQGEKRILEQ